MRKKLITVMVTLCLLFSSIPALGHSGRTDSSGGHRDNNNVSGLGYYHYHCGGYPPHLHSNGACPYRAPSYSSNKVTASTVKSKPRLSTPVISAQHNAEYNYISWDKVKNAKNYSVYRATSKNGDYTKLISTTKLYYYDRAASTNKTYYYKVKAFNAGKYERSYFSKPKVVNKKNKSSNEQRTVYVTQTGSKYHKKGCQYLSSSKIAISFTDATWQGYNPCSRCY